MWCNVLVCTRFVFWCPINKAQDILNVNLGSRIDDPILSSIELRIWDKIEEKPFKCRSNIWTRFDRHALCLHIRHIRRSDDLKLNMIYFSLFVNKRWIWFNLLTHFLQDEGLLEKYRGTSSVPEPQRLIEILFWNLLNDLIYLLIVGILRLMMLLLSLVCTSHIYILLTRLRFRLLPTCQDTDKSVSPSTDIHLFWYNMSR